MFYYNARYRFTVPDIEPPISGSIIAASAVSYIDLQKRKLGKFAHLKKRHLDPQLYMATVDEALDPKVVQKLGTYPWFHGNDIPQYDSDEHESPTMWKKTVGPQIVSKWTRTVPTDPATVRNAAKAAITLQISLGCEIVLLPGPLTTMADLSLQAEIEWIDAGLSVCQEMGVTIPVYATIAIAEDSLQIPPLTNSLVHSFPNQIASRDLLAGAYIVLEQSDPNNYFWTSRNPLASLLTIIDDLHRGARKKTVVNYLGTFGLVAAAVGANVWSSGYYLSQRRFSRRGSTGRAYPRYHSMALATDIGLRYDLEQIVKAGLQDKLMSPSSVDSGLRTALKAGQKPDAVAEWEYSQSNITASIEHYLELSNKAATEMSAKSATEKINWVQNWLTRAVHNVAEVNQKTSLNGTDLLHQRIWLDVFEAWRGYAKQ